MSNTPQDNEAFFKALAIALVQHPRATLQELAAAVGVSRATLYRFAPSREALKARVHAHCVELFLALVKDARLDQGDPREALCRLVSNHVSQQEFISFARDYSREGGGACEEMWDTHMHLLDAFFLRGQKLGAFRMDVPAVYLCELFAGIITGFSDARQRGRVAPAGLDTVICSLLLSGAAAEPGDKNSP